MAPRLYLLTPGHLLDRLRSGLDSGADCLIAELEDGVPDGQMDTARESVATLLAERDPGETVYVRINPLDDGGHDDLDALLGGTGDGQPDGILVPKVERAADVESVASAVADRDADVGLHPVIESPAGIVNLGGLVGVDAVESVQFGPGDLAADLGILPSEEMDELAYARQKLVMTAAAAGVDAVDAPSREVRDADAIRADAQRSADLGFDGKVAIHPAQLEVLREVFYPTEADVEWAKRVLDARDEALAEGNSVFEVDGDIMLHPHVVRAEDIVEHAE